MIINLGAHLSIMLDHHGIGICLIGAVHFVTVNFGLPLVTFGMGVI